MPRARRTRRRLTPLGSPSQTADVAFRRQTAAGFVLFALTMAPELLWLAAHALEHHGHELEAGLAHREPAGLGELAEILVHGHHHPQDVPDHHHDSLVSSAARFEGPRSRVAVEVAWAEPAMGSLPLRSRSSSVWLVPRLAAESPPRLQSLCTLLI